MSQNEYKMSRRRFIGRSVLAGLQLPLLSACSGVKKRSAADRVVFEKSGIRLSRLGMGTGTNGGRVQREMGQQEFTRVLRYGIERGLTYIDTADNYHNMHEMVREAIKGVDRETLQIQSKISWSKYSDPLKEIDRFRQEAGTDYFDSLLIHCVTKESWPADTEALQDQLSEAKARGWIRAHGVSIHGLEPLAAATQNLSWPDHYLLRVNHNGQHMDGPEGKWREIGDRDAALKHIKKLHDLGTPVIGMKLIGNGDFVDFEERRASIQFVMGLDYVDAVVIGFKSIQEIDEAIEQIDLTLNA